MFLLFCKYFNGEGNFYNGEGYFISENSCILLFKGKEIVKWFRYLEKGEKFYKFS